jgi:hypothetical protein
MGDGCEKHCCDVGAGLLGLVSGSMTVAPGDGESGLREDRMSRFTRSRFGLLGKSRQSIVIRAYNL